MQNLVQWSVIKFGNSWVANDGIYSTFYFILNQWKKNRAMGCVCNCTRCNSIKVICTTSIHYNRGKREVLDCVEPSIILIFSVGSSFIICSFGPIQPRENCTKEVLYNLGKRESLSCIEPSKISHRSHPWLLQTQLILIFQANETLLQT